MSRLGYKCDGCGDEYRGREPAAFIDGGDDVEELCSDCYDEWWGDEQDG